MHIKIKDTVFAQKLSAVFYLTEKKKVSSMENNYKMFCNYFVYFWLYTI